MIKKFGSAFWVSKPSGEMGWTDVFSVPFFSFICNHQSISPLMDDFTTTQNCFLHIKLCIVVFGVLFSYSYSPNHDISSFSASVWFSPCMSFPAPACALWARPTWTRHPAAAPGHAQSSPRLQHWPSCSTVVWYETKGERQGKPGFFNCLLNTMKIFNWWLSSPTDICLQWFGQLKMSWALKHTERDKNLVLYMKGSEEVVAIRSPRP